MIAPLDNHLLVAQRMDDSDQRPFRGIIPPVITPLLDRDRLDIDGLERLVEHLIAGGVSGLFILGTTGEAPSLSYHLRRELIERVCKQVGDRTAVLVGITDTAYVESVKLAQTAAEANASALVLTTPYYFPAGQTELIDYVSKIIPELPLPLMLYNMPSMTKVWFEIETLKRLSGIERIIGVKDSSGDMDYFSKLLSLRSERKDWSILMGPEHLMIKSVAMGGDGGVNGGANIYPQLFVDAYHAAVARDEALISELQAKIDHLQKIYAIGKYASRYIKAIKSAASIRGICSDAMAEPFHHFKEPERKLVKEVLGGMKQ